MLDGDAGLDGGLLDLAAGDPVLGKAHLVDLVDDDVGGTQILDEVVHDAANVMDKVSGSVVLAGHGRPTFLALGQSTEGVLALFTRRYDKFEPNWFNFSYNASTLLRRCLIPGRYKIQFAWVGGGLRETCLSEKLLRRRFGEAATAVKYVLTVLSQSESLGDVRTLRSIQLDLIPPTRKHLGRLLIRHKEIDVTTEMLIDDTTVCDTGSVTSEWSDSIHTLRIISINSNAA